MYDGMTCKGSRSLCCSTAAGLFRNPMRDVARFLRAFHAGHFRVYNLCIERGYSEADIGGSVVQYPLYDGQV